ncbi:MAG: flavin reductase family protein [Rhodospirillales bacterium]|nr:flavin reductase family protein [Rhodospirillales bacterium]
MTVVTGILPSGEPAGMTASAFTSVSVDPPLISVCFAKSTQCLDAFIKGTHFTVNVLSDSQKEHSQNFACRADDKFSGFEYKLGKNGCPVFPGNIATVQCALEAIHDAGDHYLVLGRVENIDSADSGDPLIHFRGAYRRIGGAI